MAPGSLRALLSARRDEMIFGSLVERTGPPRVAPQILMCGLCGTCCLVHAVVEEAHGNDRYSEARPILVWGLPYTRGRQFIPYEGGIE